MKITRRYIPLLIEGIIFTILFTLLVVITDEVKYDEKISTTTTMKEFVISEPRYIEIKNEVVYNPIVNDNKVLKTYTGNISFYGPDCGGCKTGYTASGYKVGTDNIYYQDKEYGTVLVVASDSSIPFGTIIRMNILGGEKYGIVLDRGDIGFGKKFLFDVLVESEKLSYQYGVSYNTKVEILRLGY